MADYCCVWMKSMCFFKCALGVFTHEIQATVGSKSTEIRTGTGGIWREQIAMKGYSKQGAKGGRPSAYKPAVTVHVSYCLTRMSGRRQQMGYHREATS